MSSQFDPYSRWLDIEVEARPPNHYDLLGLEPFESDVDTIDTAYRTRYALVRKYQVGEKSSYALQLVTELSKAHDCLSDSSLRRSYDRQLRGEAPVDESGADQLVVRKKSLPEGRVKLKQQLTDIVREQEAGPVADGETDSNFAPDTATWDAAEPETAGIGDNGLAGAVAVPPPQAVWHLKTPDGLRFGPMTEQELDYQVQQGSVGAACQIFREGWDRPRWARDLYTGLYDSGSAQVGGQDLGTASQFSPDAATGPPAPPAFQSTAPYKMLDPHGTQRGSKLIFAGGMALLGLGLFVVVGAFARLTFLSVMAATAGTVGVVILVIGLLEAAWLLNSPPGAAIRGQFGDRTTRSMIVAIGTILLLLSFLVLGLQGGRGIYRIMASGKQAGDRPQAGNGQTKSRGRVAQTKTTSSNKSKTSNNAKTSNNSKGGNSKGGNSKGGNSKGGNSKGGNAGPKEMGTSSGTPNTDSIPVNGATVGTPNTKKGGPATTVGPAGDLPPEKWQIVRRLDFGERVYALGFRPDGTTVAASGSQSTATWPIAAGGEKQPLDQPVANARALAWSADGRFLAAGGRDVIRIWDAKSRQLLRSLTSPSPGAVRTLAFTPNGGVLAASSQLRKTVQLWKVDDGTMFSDFIVNPRAVNKVQFTQGNNELAVAGGDAVLRLFDAQQGKELKQWPGRFLGTVRDVAVSKNGDLLATANSDGKIRVWGRTDAVHDKNWRAPIGSRVGGFNAIAFHPDSRVLATTIFGDSKVTLWDATSGKKLGQFEGHTRPIQVITFSPDGRFFASADDRGQILVYGSR